MPANPRELFRLIVHVIADRLESLSGLLRSVAVLDDVYSVQHG